MATLAELLEPLPGKIIVQIKTSDEITASGLFLPEEVVRSRHERRANQGTIVAIGIADVDDDFDTPDYLQCKVCQEKFYDDERASHHKVTESTPTVIHETAEVFLKPRLKVGDVVIFGKYSGTELKYQPPFDNEGKNIVERKARPNPEVVIILGYKDILTRVRSADEAALIRVRPNA